jgi:hypothetical protein
MSKIEVSLFPHAETRYPVKTASLGGILGHIRRGTYAQQIQHVQAQLTMGKEAYSAAKKRLPCFTPAGTFSPTRAKAHLIQSTRLIHYDLDDLADVATAKAMLAQDVHVLHAFVSPSGAGLKFAMLVDIDIPNHETYKHAWASILGYLRRQYPTLAVANDDSCSDISRLCFVSHDPALYINAQAQPFEVPPHVPIEQPRKAYKPFAPSSMDDERRRVEEALNVLPAAEYALWLRISQALHASGASWAFDVWDAWSRGGDHYKESENHRKWNSFKSDGGVNLATVFYLAKAHGYQPSKTDHDTPRQALRTSLRQTLRTSLRQTLRRSF